MEIIERPARKEPFLQPEQRIVQPVRQEHTQARGQVASPVRREHIPEER